MAGFLNLGGQQQSMQLVDAAQENPRRIKAAFESAPLRRGGVNRLILKQTQIWEGEGGIILILLTLNQSLRRDFEMLANSVGDGLLPQEVRRLRRV